jgi:hypothetical protein
MFSYGGPVLISLFVNVFFLVYANSTRPQDHHANLPANKIANFDFLFMLLTGLVLFAFPERVMVT